MKQTRIEDVLQKRDVEPLKKAGIRTLEQLILYHSYDLPLSKAAAGRVLSAATLALARKYFKDVTYDNDVVFIRTEKSPVTKKVVEHFFGSLYRQIEEVADGYKVTCKTENVSQSSLEWCKSSLQEAATRLSTLITIRAEEEGEGVVVEEEEEELEELEGVEEEKPESFEEFASLFFSEIHGNDLMKKCLAASLLSTPEEPVHTLVVGEPGTAKTLAVDLLSSLKDVEVAGPLVTRAGLVINYQSGELGVLPQANGKIVVIDEFDKAPKQDFKLTYELISTGRCVVHAANIHKIIRSRFVLIAMANPTHGVFKGSEGDLPFDPPLLSRFSLIVKSEAMQGKPLRDYIREKFLHGDVRTRKVFSAWLRSARAHRPKIVADEEKVSSAFDEMASIIEKYGNSFLRRDARFPLHARRVAMAIARAERKDVDDEVVERALALIKETLKQWL